MAMVATVVLYVAAIDRIALGMHLSYARDTETPLSKRMTACQGAANTFFFAKTASSRLRAIAGAVPGPGRWPEGCRFRDRCPRAEPVCARAEPGKPEALSPDRWSACRFARDVVGGAP